MGSAVVVGPAAAVAAAASAAAGAVGVPVVGAGVLAPLVAPALALGAAGPLGWVALAGGVMSGIIIVAGDEEFKEKCCWEQVLRLDERKSWAAAIPEHKVQLCREHGMLLSDLCCHCEVMKTTEEGNESEKLIVKNEFGEYFAFSVSLVVPAGTYKEGPNATHDVSVVHAVKVSPV
ncbi:hypothetical protein K438DRAFT_2019758 [Mycena galopus ATCC 62051]|nr:hypothetical protein K438DRAFT_2019758 [Mycena galopus ATCC 62051]